MSRLELRHLATRLGHPGPQPTPPTDAELLGRFAATHDENAFAELVSRHGGLVRGTARRCLRDSQVAEDVYQATFLTLARKAGGVKWGATVGPWLHATAVRLARKALRRPGPATVTVSDDVSSSGIDPASAVAWGEACQALDEELSALPEKLRIPLVLCYLQGLSREEAMNAIGCTLAMLKRRLERGRSLLRDRLTRRGVTLPVAGIGLLACDLPICASATHTTTRAAIAFITQGIASPGAAGLLDASSRLLRLKAVAFATLAVGLVVCGVTYGALTQPDGEQPGTATPPPVTASKADTTPRADIPSEALPPGAIARLGTVRLRTGGSIGQMAFSPDGSKIVSFSSEMYTHNTLTIWETATGRALRHVEMSAGVNPLVWLADGRGIALVHPGDGPAYLWEFTDDKAEKPPIVPRTRQEGVFTTAVPEQVQDNEDDACYAISPDGKSLAIGRAGHLEANREVQLWELKTGDRVNTLKPLKGGVIHPGNCGSVYFTPDAKTLVVLTATKHLGNDKWESEQLITVWDVATSREKTRFKAPRPATNHRLAVALSTNTLAIGLENGNTSLWDLTTGKERKLATEHNSRTPGEGFGTFAVAFSPDGKVLATGGRDCVTKLWDVGTGKPLHALVGHSTWVEVLAIGLQGKLLVSAGQDGMIRLWDTATGADACPLPGHKYIIGDVALSADGTLALTGGWDNTLRWWNVATGTEQRSVPVPEGPQGMALSPDNKTVLIATDDGKLRTWDAKTGIETTPAILPAGVKFQHFAFTPDRKHLITASGPKVAIWEWPVMKLTRTIDIPKPQNTEVVHPGATSQNDCNVAAISPDGKWIVTVATHSWSVERNGLRYGYASDGIVDVWEFTTGRHVRRLVDAPAAPRTGMFTPDGRFIVIGAGGKIPSVDGGNAEAFSGEINVLDPVAGRWVRSFAVPLLPKTVSHRYFGGSTLTPDGRTLYVSDNTGEIIGYEVATGKPRRTLLGHKDYVSGLATSADGRRLISGGRDGIAMVWDTTLAGVATPRKNSLTVAEAEKLWETVCQDEARAAYAAMAELVASPDRAVEAVRKGIKPAPAAPPDAVLDRIFRELGSDDFSTREQASKELEEYGESAVHGARKRLEISPSPEARRRAEDFLRATELPQPSASRLRQVRGVELLEGLGTPAARKLLADLAGGAATAPLTSDAVASLKRLNNQ